MQRTLPKTSTDFGLLDDLIRVHESTAIDVDRSLYTWWKRWNKIYFENTLRPLFLHYGLSDYGRALGHYALRPVREILIQKVGRKKSEQCLSVHVAAKHHEAFKDLSKYQYSLALVLLHEMMHQSEHETGGSVGDNCHQTTTWLEYCNFIGNDLGLGLTYSTMARQKVSKTDDEGNIVKNAQGQTMRKNIWKPKAKELLPNTVRFATYDECRRFPFRESKEEKDNSTL